MVKFGHILGSRFKLTFSLEDSGAVQDLEEWTVSSTLRDRNGQMVETLDVQKSQDNKKVTVRATTDQSTWPAGQLFADFKLINPDGEVMLSNEFIIQTTRGPSSP